MATRLQEQYDTVIRSDLQASFNYANPMQIPRLDKVVLNMGVGEAVADSKKIDAAARDMTAISGQKPIIIRARKSVAQFKLREGMPIGCTVTLRGDRMYEFLDRLISVALPRVRDFRGIGPKSFDGRGNYTLGVREHTIFPEIDYTKTENVKGMNVTIVTTAKKDGEALSMLTRFGMPFRK